MPQRFVAIHETPQRVAIFGRGSMPPPPGVKDRSRQRLVREPQGPAEGSPASRGAVRAAAAGRHSPLRLQDRLRKTPLMSEDANL